MMMGTFSYILIAFKLRAVEVADQTSEEMTQQLEPDCFRGMVEEFLEQITSSSSFEEINNNQLIRLYGLAHQNKRG